MENISNELINNDANLQDISALSDSNSRKSYKREFDPEYSDKITDLRIKRVRSVYDELEVENRVIEIEKEQDTSNKLTTLLCKRITVYQQVKTFRNLLMN